MNEAELKRKIVNDYKTLLSDIAASQTLIADTNPFSNVTLNREFLEAELTDSILSEEEVNKITKEIDKSIEEDKSLKDVVGLIGTGLKLLAKYGVLL